MSRHLSRSRTPYDIFIDADCAVASTFGERQGRTVSRVIGGTISDLTGLSEDAATQVGHAAMVAATFVPQVRVVTTAALVGAFLLGRR